MYKFLPGLRGPLGEGVNPHPGWNKTEEEAIDFGDWLINPSCIPSAAGRGGTALSEPGGLIFMP